MAPRENRRRTRVVDRSFQVGLAVRLIFALALFLAAGLTLAFAPSVYVLATTNDLKSLEPAAAEFLVLHKRLWPAALLSFAGIFFYVIFVSHRIAGPVYRIDAILRALIDGRDPEVTKFRDGDFFQPTAALLRELTEKIRGSHDSGDARSGDGPPPRTGVT